MKIQVEFHTSHKSDVYEVGRIPCVGEDVFLDWDGPSYEVKSVAHYLNADPQTQVLALVRVK